MKRFTFDPTDEDLQTKVSGAIYWHVVQEPPIDPLEEKGGAVASDLLYTVTDYARQLSEDLVSNRGSRVVGIDCEGVKATLRWTLEEHEAVLVIESGG